MFLRIILAPPSLFRCGGVKETMHMRRYGFMGLTPAAAAEHILSTVVNS